MVFFSWAIFKSFSFCQTPKQRKLRSVDQEPPFNTNPTTRNNSSSTSPWFSLNKKLITMAPPFSPSLVEESKKCEFQMLQTSKRFLGFLAMPSCKKRTSLRLWCPLFSMDYLSASKTWQPTMEGIDFGWLNRFFWVIKVSWEYPLTQIKWLVLISSIFKYQELNCFWWSTPRTNVFFFGRNRSPGHQPCKLLIC